MTSCAASIAVHKGGTELRRGVAAASDEYRAHPFRPG